MCSVKCSALPGTGGAQCPQLCHQGSAMQALAHRSWLLAPSPPLLSTQSPPCTPNLGLSEPMAQWVRLSLLGQLHTCVCLEIWGSGSRALFPLPQAEAQNSPEGSHSSATQRTQRQGTCRSGKSCSRCRVCLSFQGPGTEADVESEQDSL